MTEQEFLKAYDSSKFEKPSVAVDLVLFTILDEKLQVLMVNRNMHPFRGMLSLPGVFVGMKETLDEAAQRALYQKTGLHDIYFEQLYTWGSVDRDPRMRIISVSYYALVPSSRIELPQGEDAPQFYPADEIAAMTEGVAFDHSRIVACGRERIRSKVNWSDIAFALVPEEFTLPQLQRVYEILLGQKLYKANFRKKIAEKIEDTNKMTSGHAHRPSHIYRKKNAPQQFAAYEAPQSPLPLEAEHQTNAEA